MNDEKKSKAQLMRELAELRQCVATLEKSYQASETRYDMLSNMLSDYATFFRVETDGNLVREWSTGSIDRILGFVSENWESRDLLARVHPEDLVKAQEYLHGLLSGKDSETIEFRIVTGKDDVRWVENRSQVVWNDREKRATHILITGRDITEQRQAEQAFQLSQEELKRTLEATTDGIWTWNFNSGKLTFSARYYEMLGYRPGEFPASFENWKALLHPDDLQQALDTSTEYLKTKPDQYENRFRLRTKDGGYRWIRAKGRVVARDNNGEALHMIGNHEDITARKQAEEALQHRAEELAELQATVLDITRPYELQDLLHLIVERAARLLKAPSGGLYLCDQDKRQIRCVVSYNTPHDYTGTTLRYGEGAAGIAVQTEQPVIIDDYRIWANRAKAFEKDQPFSAVLMVPMISDGQVTGTINVLDKVENRRFSQEDLELLTLFANHAAVAVEHARLHDRAEKEIAERKRAEAEQARSRQRLESLWKIASMVDASHQTLCDSILKELLSMTSSQYAFYGFLTDDEKEMSIYSWSKKALDLCRVQDQPLVYPIVESGLWGDAVRNREPVLVNDYQADHPGKQGLPDGHVALTRVLSVPIFSDQRIVAVAAVANKPAGYDEDDTRQIQAFAGSVQLILERRQADEKIRQSEERYRGVAESSQDSIFIIDRDDRISYVNHFAANQLGMHPEAMIGKPRETLFPSEVNQDQATDLKQVFDTGRTIRREAITRFPDRDRWLDTYLVPLFGENGEVTSVMGISRDITESKQLQAQLIQAQKMDTVGRLAGGIAHEFNNLLSAVIGYAGFAAEALPAGDPVRQDIEQALKASKQLADLTYRILSFAQRQMIVRQTLNLNTLIVDMQPMLARIMGKKVKQDIKLEPKLGMVNIDLKAIEHVLVNLALNGHDAMSDGGNLTIETLNINLEETHASGMDLQPGPYIMLAISDTGVGMNDEVKAHLFEPFFTTKDVGQGTGLGLAAAYGLIKQHGGGIRVLSEEGKGSRFEIYLPQVNSSTKVMS